MYAARHRGDVVQLEDTTTRTVVSIVPSVGNNAYSMKVHGQDVIRWPFASVEDFKATPGLSGMPFLAPWANRLDEQAFYANGKRYAFDMALGNVRGAIPSHGFLTASDQWQVVEVNADGHAAWVTSRLDFYKNAASMTQWPFAHTVEMTHRLQDGVLQVRTTIRNMAADPMPVSVGFHPFYRLTDSPRDEWTVTVPAKTHWILADNKVPTGETEPAGVLFPNGRSGPLKAHTLDDVFSDLVRDDEGRAHIVVTGRRQQLEIVLGPNWRSLVMWSPDSDADFICVEPMAGVTNAMNLAQAGKYNELQYVPPGGTWSESFWTQPRGF
jgi:aldose 1-epimerase